MLILGIRTDAYCPVLHIDLRRNLSPVVFIVEPTLHLAYATHELFQCMQAQQGQAHGSPASGYSRQPLKWVWHAQNHADDVGHMGTCPTARCAAHNAMHSKGQAS